MTMDQAFKYRAFVSYCHSDHEMAAWLHASLEAFKIPKGLLSGQVERRLGRVFRDEAELPSGDLPAMIEEALGQSQSLIVMCSPAAAKSLWVNKEIMRFRELRPDGGVFAFVIDGQPNAKLDAEECFPPALRGYDVGSSSPSVNALEVLAPDVRRFGKDGVLLRLIAGMLGVGFDDLFQREERRQRSERRRALALSSIGIALILVALAGIGGTTFAAMSLERSRADLLASYAEQAASEGRHDLARWYAMNALPPTGSILAPTPRAQTAALLYARFAPRVWRFSMEPGSSPAAFLSTSNHALVILTRGEVTRFSLSDLEEVPTTLTGLGEVNSVATTPTAATAIAWHAPNMQVLEVFDANTLQRTGQVRIPFGPTERVELSPDGRWAAVLGPFRDSSDGWARFALIDIVAQRVVMDRQFEESYCPSFAFHPGSRFLETSIGRFDLRTRTLQEYDGGGPRFVTPYGVVLRNTGCGDRPIFVNLGDAERHGGESPRIAQSGFRSGEFMAPHGRWIALFNAGRVDLLATRSIDWDALHGGEEPERTQIELPVRTASIFNAALSADHRVFAGIASNNQVIRLATFIQRVDWQNGQIDEIADVGPGAAYWQFDQEISYRRRNDFYLSADGAWFIALTDDTALVSQLGTPKDIGWRQSNEVVTAEQDSREEAQQELCGATETLSAAGRRWVLDAPVEALINGGRSAVLIDENCRGVLRVPSWMEPWTRPPSVSPDGRYILLGMAIVDLEAMAAIPVPRPSQEAVTSTSWSANNNLLARTESGLVYELDLTDVALADLCDVRRVPRGLRLLSSDLPTGTQLPREAAGDPCDRHPFFSIEYFAGLLDVGRR